VPEKLKLAKPWLVAVWPGMGHVAIGAGYYLVAKLGMQLLAEFSAQELFEVEHVEVRDGLVRTGRLPSSRLFAWIDPSGKHDIIVFIGEAQPPRGKHAFCRKLIEYALELGVERVFTFAAMATQMHPKQDSRVFGAAADEDSLERLRQLELEILENGYIGGLNGVLLGVAAESGLRGACLLGEMPHIFTEIPFPKASLAVLEVFTTIADIEIDFTELGEQVRTMEQDLDKLIAKAQEASEQQTQAGGEALSIAPPEEEGLSPEEVQRVEELFEQAKQDRAKAYELKRELDRLHVFRQYEDRFLDLFTKPD